MKMRWFAVLGLLAAVAAAPADAAAEDEPTSLADAVRAFVESGPTNVDSELMELLRRNPDPLEVMPLLRDTGADAEPGWRVLPHRYGDGKVRDFHLYVPTSLDPEEPAPLLIHMHGGVSRPALLTEAEMRGYRDWWTPEAERLGMLVVFPLGEQGAEWWTETQASALEEIVRDLSRDFRIDRNRVFTTGFSDGGSGSFYLSLTHPTTYAGFIPLNGHPAVASGASGRNLFPLNHGMRPLYVVNTQDDQLYPSAAMMPFIRSMMEAGVAVRFTSYPGIGHRPDYRDEQNPLIGEWILDTERDPLPDRVVWQTADLDTGRCAWVTILALGDTPGAPEAADVNVMMPAGRVMLGIRVDMAFEGEGVRIESVTEETLAAEMGLAAGDVIRRIDDLATPDLGALRAALGGKEHGDAVRVEWAREGDAHAAEGRFPEYVPEPTYRRDRPSGRIEVTREGNRVDVRLSGVTRYALDLSPAEFDFDEEIVVTTNRKESFRGVVKPELETLLLSFRDRDPDLLFLARLRIDVVPGEEDGRIEATARDFLAGLAAGDGDRSWALAAENLRTTWDEMRDRLAMPPGDGYSPLGELAERVRRLLGDDAAIPGSGRALWNLCAAGDPDRAALERPGRAEVDHGEHGVSVRFPGIAVRVWLRPEDDGWRVETNGPDWAWPHRWRRGDGPELVALHGGTLTQRPLEPSPLPDVPGARSFDLVDDALLRLSMDGEGRVVHRGATVEEDALEARFEPWPEADVLALAAAPDAPTAKVLGLLRRLPAGFPDWTEPRFREVRFMTALHPRSRLARGIPASVRPAPGPRVRLEERPEVAFGIGPAGLGAEELAAIGHRPVEGARVRLSLDGRMRWEDALRILATIGAGRPGEIFLDEREVEAGAPAVTLDGAPLGPSDKPLDPPDDVRLELRIVLR